MRSASATSSLVNPQRSRPNRIATRPSPAISRAMSRAAASGASTGFAWSCARAVVANTSVQSAMAAAAVSNSFAPSIMASAPDAARLAWMFGQPSRGLTMRSSDRPKLPMARAAMPIFCPSCGSTSTTIGAATFAPAVLLSVSRIASISTRIRLPFQRNFSSKIVRERQQAVPASARTREHAEPGTGAVICATASARPVRSSPCLPDALRLKGYQRACFQPASADAIAA